MALLTPTQIEAVLQEARLTPKPKESKDSIRDLLDKNNLSVDEVLNSLALIMQSGDSDNVRLQAAKIGAQLNGLLSTTEGAIVPVVNIIIKDSQVGEINPILLVRQ